MPRGTVARSDPSVKGTPAPPRGDTGGGLALFLRGASRPSTLAVGRWVWDRLKDHPSGRPLNQAEAARALGLSRRTVQLALAAFARWGRLLPVADRSTGRRHPGRARAWRLHPCYFVAERLSPPCQENAGQDVVSAKRATSTNTSLKSRPCLTDPSRGPSGDPNALMAGGTARNLILSRVREEIRAWPVSWATRATVMAGVGPAVHRATVRDGKIRTRGEAVALARALIVKLRGGEAIGRSRRSACAFGRWAVTRALAELAQHRADMGERQASATQRRDLEAERQAARATWTREAVAWVKATLARAVRRRVVATSCSSISPN